MVRRDFLEMFRVELGTPGGYSKNTLIEKLNILQGFAQIVLIQEITACIGILRSLGKRDTLKAVAQSEAYMNQSTWHLLSHGVNDRKI